MIKHNDYGLGGFHLVESSEQGMLAEVARAVSARKPVVFLAWDPHPMNMQFDLHYLTGGDATFGPNFGGARVLTVTRAGYLQQCPNVAQLLRNLVFTTRGESEVMRSILVDHQTPEVAARNWLTANPAVKATWLEGVHTSSGQDGDRVEQRSRVLAWTFDSRPGSPNTSFPWVRPSPWGLNG